MLITNLDNSDWLTNGTLVDILTDSCNKPDQEVLIVILKCNSICPFYKIHISTPSMTLLGSIMQKEIQGPERIAPFEALTRDQRGSQIYNSCAVISYMFLYRQYSVPPFSILYQSAVLSLRSLADIYKLGPVC